MSGCLFPTCPRLQSFREKVWRRGVTATTDYPSNGDAKRSTVLRPVDLFLVKSLREDVPTIDQILESAGDLEDLQHRLAWIDDAHVRIASPNVEEGP